MKLQNPHTPACGQAGKGGVWGTRANTSGAQEGRLKTVGCATRREKYGVNDVKKYYAKFDVAVLASDALTAL